LRKREGLSTFIAAFRCEPNCTTLHSRIMLVKEYYLLPDDPR
jgi:hypothetical protein